MTDDYWAINNLVIAYAERIDGGDFEGLAELLGDCDLTTEGDDTVRHGPEAVLRMYTRSTRRYEDGTPKTKHVTTNIVIELDEGGTTASSRSYYTVLQAVPGALTLQPIIAGRYRDTFAKDGTWRFASRHIVVDLLGDLSRHLLFELPPR
jgi:hypothetical protein